MPRKFARGVRLIRPLRAALSPLALILLFGAQCGVGTLRVEVFECEEAVQHIENCCGVPLRVNCDFSSSCSSGPRPDIPRENAYLLRTSSCEELVASGFCADPQGQIDGISGSPDMSTSMRPELATDAGADLR